MTQQYIAPTFRGNSFNCPHCDVLAKQDRSIIKATSEYCIYIASCQHCNKISIWYGENVFTYQSTFFLKEGIMYFPKATNMPLPNDDLEQDIQDDYVEAANIVDISPRGACALLRLALQKLMVQVGEDGKDINKNIANLVKKGLNPTIQQALDTLRVVGNEAVHPGELDLKDDTNTASHMFILINLIAENLITQPKKIADLYQTLPQDKLDGIATRDGN